MLPPMLSVIATSGRRQLLDRTLASIDRATRPGQYQGVIVIENGHQDGVEEIVAQWNQRYPVQYLYHSHANKSAALNRVLSHVGEALLYFHDDDITLHPDALTAIAAAAAHAETPSFFGGPVTADSETIPPQWLAHSLPPSARGWPSADRADREPTCFLGANWAAAASDLRAAGGFNEQLGPGKLAPGEETAIQRRLLDMGLQSRFVPEALVFHYIPRERCSPLWTLRRCYRHGIASELERGAPEPQSSAAPNQTLLGRIVRRCRAEVRGANDLPRLFFHALVVASRRGGSIHAKFRRRFALRDGSSGSPS